MRLFLGVICFGFGSGFCWRKAWRAETDRVHHTRVSGGSWVEGRSVCLHPYPLRFAPPPVGTPAGLAVDSSLPSPHSFLLPSLPSFLFSSFPSFLPSVPPPSLRPYFPPLPPPILPSVSSTLRPSLPHLSLRPTSLPFPSLPSLHLSVPPPPLLRPPLPPPSTFWTSLLPGALQSSGVGLGGRGPLPRPVRVHPRHRGAPGRVWRQAWWVTPTSGTQDLFRFCTSILTSGSVPPY